MKKRTKLILAAFVFGGVVSLGAFFQSAYFFSTSIEDSAVPVEEVQVFIPPVEERYPFEIPKRSTLSAELAKHGLSSLEIHNLVDAAKDTKNLARILPGTRYQVNKTEGEAPEVTSIRFRFSPADILLLTKDNGIWSAKKIEKPITKKIVSYQGVVRSSLWDSAANAAMNPGLIIELTELFAWQVDFAREVQVNDQWRLTVEQEFIHNEQINLGTILSAEYVNNGQPFTAVLFKKGDEKIGYFAPDGSSLRRMFLKSPLKFGRISSRFNRARFHPVLKVPRAHLGVDYAAPIGTPVRAVGDGVVQMAGWSGGGGKVIKIRHNSTYQTAYKHLNGYGKGVTQGARVRQGQVIGYVGNTGLSTGPHLHFEFYVNGAYVDPMGQKFPKADPVPKNDLALFFESQKEFLQKLPTWESKTSGKSDRDIANEKNQASAAENAAADDQVSSH